MPGNGSPEVSTLDCRPGHDPFWIQYNSRVELYTLENVNLGSQIVPVSNGYKKYLPGEVKEVVVILSTAHHPHSADWFKQLC